MENGQIHELDALYIQWSENQSQAQPTALREWLDRYPRYATDLTRWTAEAPLATYAEKVSVYTTLESRAKETGQSVLAEARAKYGLSPVLSSLYDTARQQGLNPKTLAAQLQIGLTVLDKLQRRLVRFTTVPEAMIQALADKLQVEVEQVRLYLQQPATLAARASYQSPNGVPQVTAQEEFTHAIQNARDMTSTQKSLWLSSETRG